MPQSIPLPPFEDHWSHQLQHCDTFTILEMNGLGKKVPKCALKAWYYDHRACIYQHLNDVNIKSGLCKRLSKLIRSGPKELRIVPRSESILLHDEFKCEEDITIKTGLRQRLFDLIRPAPKELRVVPREERILLHDEFKFEEDIAWTGTYEMLQASRCNQWADLYCPEPARPSTPSMPKSLYYSETPF